MNDKIKEIKAHIERIDEILDSLIEEKPKAKVEIRVSGNTGPFEDMDELVEKFSKDLEEMLNDIAEERKD